MKGTLELLGMTFHAFHGCYDFEREKGTQYIVDFSAEVELDLVLATDNIKHAIDYGIVYQIIEAEMKIPSNLIENVGARIFQALEKNFPELEHFSISLSKLHPPVSGPADRAKITISR